MLIQLHQLSGGPSRTALFFDVFFFPPTVLVCHWLINRGLKQASNIIFLFSLFAKHKTKTRETKQNT